MRRTTLLVAVCGVVAPGCGTCRGDFELRGQADAAQLAHCRVVTGSLTVDGDSTLASLGSLGRLQEVHDLNVIGSDGLADLAGLDSLRRVGNGIEVQGNRSLASLRGLESLESVQKLVVWNNSALESLDGLESLTEVKLLVSVAGNPNLLSLEGIPVLEAVDTLDVTDNRALEGMDGFDSLQSVGTLGIRRNESLRGIVGLEGIVVVTDELTVTENPLLCDAEVTSWADVVAPDADVSISGNGGACDGR